MEYGIELCAFHLLCQKRDCDKMLLLHELMFSLPFEYTIKVYKIWCPCNIGGTPMLHGHQSLHLWWPINHKGLGHMWYIRCIMVKLCTYFNMDPFKIKLTFYLLSKEPFLVQFGVLVTSWDSWQYFELLLFQIWMIEISI